MATNWDDETHVSIHDSTSTPDALKPITSTVDGAKRRFDVTLGESFSFQLQAFAPVTDFDSTGVTITSAGWTTLLTVPSSKGKLDFIACVGGSSGYRVRLTVDGTECYDLAMTDLNAIGLSNATNVPIWAETANKNFRYNPSEPVDFVSSVLIEAQAIGSDVLLKYLITYRTAV